MRNPTSAGVAGTVGALLVAVGVTLAATAPPAVPADLGSVPSGPAAGSSAAPVLPPDGEAAAGARAPRSPDVARTPAPRATTAKPAAPARPPVRPVRIALPGSKEVPVVPARVSRAGELLIPERVSQVGWWVGGASLGDGRGSIVLAGHVDSLDEGLGAFASLSSLRPGQRVVLTGADGRRVTFSVSGRRSYRKERLPSSVFALDVAPRLVLITCTGRYDEAAASYAENLVVYATPEAG